jgi:hypothetical protein
VLWNIKNRLLLIVIPIQVMQGVGLLCRNRVNRIPGTEQHRSTSRYEDPKLGLRRSKGEEEDDDDERR